MASEFIVFFAFAMTALLPQMTFGCAYEFEQKTNFSCPEDYHINRLESQYNATVQDRKWCYECTDGFVTHQCSWQDLVESLEDLLLFVCPNNGLITGVYSKYSDSHFDRLYGFKCCNVSVLQNTIPS